MYIVYITAEMKNLTARLRQVARSSMCLVAVCVVHVCVNSPSIYIAYAL